MKIGDSVYWFSQGPDGMVDNVDIEKLYIRSTFIVADAEIRQRDWGYCTRREALEALSKKLKELLDYENTI